MMLKKFRCLALVMSLILVVIFGTTFAAKKPIKLVYGHDFTADHFFSKGDRYFKELVEKKSKGTILVDFFPALQLGSATEMLQATRSNAQQITLTSPGALTSILPKIGTLELPYLYRDDAHQIKVAKRISSIIDQDAIAAKTDLRILNVRIRAPRHLTTKFPVHKLGDIKGLKIRSPENKLYMRLWQALGAVPTVIPMTDVYTALATGTIDAQENPFDSIYTWKIYEQVKYCALTAHIRSLSMMVINNSCWNSLTEKQRKIITNAAAKSAEMGFKDVEKDEKKCYNLLVKKGMKFTKPKLAPFREKAKTIWREFGDAELIKKVEAIK
jgi:tripartite ATP-independent transporter DctP family solute receptor